jgi:hypothetical protein
LIALKGEVAAPIAQGQSAEHRWWAERHSAGQVIPHPEGET